MNSKSLWTVALVTLTACGGGSGLDAAFAGESPTDETLTAVPAIDLPPADTAAFRSILTTRYSNMDNYDYWHCVQESSSAEAFILMPESGTLADGLQQGLEIITPGQSGGFRLLWEATSVSSFMLEYPEQGVAYDYTDVVFSDINTMQIDGGSLFGLLGCARNSFGTTPTPTTTTAPTASDDIESPDTNLEASGEIEGLHAMFGFFVNRILASGFIGLTGDAVLAFEDGTYTDDISGVVNDGVEASRANNPEDWGTWRGAAGSLELKDWNDTEYDEANRSFLIQPGSSDQKLDGCYSRIGGSGSLFPNGVGVVTTATYCFHENGRFTNDSSVWNQGATADVTFVDPQTVGQYRINGHVAEFMYDSGLTVNAAFGFTDLNRDPGSIYLNSLPYVE